MYTLHDLPYDSPKQQNQKGYSAQWYVLPPPLTLQQPKDDSFAKLETLHAEQSVLQASIIVAAARITDSEHATRRDAIMTAAAGTMNWQCRQEFNSYVKHAVPRRPSTATQSSNGSTPQPPSYEQCPHR